jgi:hypothetical protein
MEKNLMGTLPQIRSAVVLAMLGVKLYAVVLLVADGRGSSLCVAAALAFVVGFQLWLASKGLKVAYRKSLYPSTDELDAARVATQGTWQQRLPLNIGLSLLVLCSAAYMVVISEAMRSAGLGLLLLQATALILWAANDLWGARAP